MELPTTPTPPSSINETIQDVSVVVNGIGSFVQQINLILSFISLCVNTPHLLVLSRKHMQTSSTNIILVGLSISDTQIMLSTIYKNYFMVDTENSDCTTSDYQLKVYLDLFVWALNSSFRRCGCWLGVLMASVRYLIVKKITVSKYGNWSQPRVGWIMVFSVFIISGLQTTFYTSRWVVVENRSFPLPKICKESQSIYNIPRYSVMLSSFFSFDTQIVLRCYLMFDAIVTKFIPCIAFSILTVLLVRALHKMKVPTENSGRKISVTAEDRKDLTTKLIIFLTFTFFLTEGPLGLIYLVKVFYNKSDPISVLSTDFIIFFTLLVTINSILHPISCILMSSQYRDTIRKMCGLKKNTKMSSARNKTSVQSVQGIQMT